MAGIWGRAKGALEAGATLASGAIAEPVAGWAGILSGGNADQMAKAREALTYAPKTPEGQATVAGIGDIIGKLKDAAMASPIGAAVNGFNAAADRAGEVSPALGAAVKTAPAALTMLFGPGGTATRQAVGNVARGTAQGVERAAIVAAENSAAVPAMRGPLAHEKGIFAGHLSKEAPIWKLEQAKTMQALGKSDQEIYAHTGWFAGSADGKWRYEIPDDQAAFNAKDGRYLTANPETNAAGEWLSMPVKDAVHHPELLAAYPDTGDINLTLKDYGSPGHGAFRGDMGEDGYISLDRAISRQPVVTANDGPFPISQADADRLNSEAQALGTHRISDPDGAMSTVLHELQHAVQGREGFARGGSAVTLQPVIDDLLAQRERLRQYADMGVEKAKTQLQDVEQQLQMYGDGDAMDAYRRLAGEAEARLVQSRMHMTPEERAASYPPDMYDVPVQDQLVRYR